MATAGPRDALCTRLIVQLDAASGCPDSYSGAAVKALQRELAALRAAADRRRRAKRLLRDSAAAGRGGGKPQGLSRAMRSLADAVGDVDVVLAHHMADGAAPKRGSPRSPAFSPVSTPDAAPAARSGIAFCAASAVPDGLARPQPQHSAPEKQLPPPSLADDPALPLSPTSSPVRPSAFRAPKVTPPRPSKRHPSSESAAAMRAGSRENIRVALLEAGAPGDHDGQPPRRHPHQALVAQLQSALSQSRADASRVLRLGDRLLAATVASLAGAAGHHNAARTLFLDVLAVPELRERVMDGLSPSDVCRCRRVSRQLMEFGDEALGRLRTLDGSEWAGISPAHLERRLPHCTTVLTSIRWSGGLGLSDDLIRVAARCAPALRTLSIRECPRLSDCGLLAVADHCTSLSTLDVSGCGGVTDASVDILSERCPGLATVDASGTAVTDAVVGLLTTRCSGLTTLKLAECAAITDGCLALMAAAAEAQPCGIELSEIDLGGCAGVSDEGIEVLATSALLCERLCGVHVDGTSVSAQGEQRLAEALQRRQAF